MDKSFTTDEMILNDGTVDPVLTNLAQALSVAPLTVNNTFGQGGLNTGYAGRIQIARMR